MVNQAPPNLFKNQGDSVTISCQHNFSTYNVIQWYRQAQSTEMTLRAYVFGTAPNYEDLFKNNTKLHGDANANKNSSITMSNLSGQDSGLYYCAASYTAQQFPHQHSKNPPHGPLLTLIGTPVSNLRLLALCLKSV